MSPILKEFLLEIAEIGSFPAGPMSISSRTISGDMPLHFAALQGNLPIVRLWVEAGAEVNARGELEYTPLDSAVEFSQTDVIKYLQSVGAVTYMEDAPNKAGGGQPATRPELRCTS